uniref:Uncharacterized protein n=1 Tax=Cacopsylla melanoneura TaxID=428564 RepID=A0A8D8ZSI4_9HEMI
MKSIVSSGNIFPQPGGLLPRKIVLFVTILLSVHSVSGLAKFGCTFKTDTYDLETGVEEPIWGQNLPPMVLASDADLNQTLAKIRTVMSDLVKNTIYDDIDELAEFANAYAAEMDKTKKRPDFETFFQSYHPKYNGPKGTPGLAIDLYERLVKVEPRVAKAYHLIAAGANIGMHMMDRLYRELSVTQIKTDPTGQLWPYPYHNHVAGFMKIVVGKRRGLMLMDPGFALQDIIVFMEDGQCPSTVKTTGSGRSPQGEHFEFELAADGAFISVHSYTPGVYRRTYNNIHERHLYYFGKPYCSFLDSTVKPNLVFPTRSIEKRNPSTGKVEASIEVALFRLTKAPVYQDKNEVDYMFTTFDVNGIPTNQQEIPLFRLGAMKDDKPVEEQFKLVCKTLALPADQVRTRITNLCALLDLLSDLYEKIQFLTGIPVDELEKQRDLLIKYDAMDKAKQKGKIVKKMFSCMSQFIPK